MSNSTSRMMQGLAVTDGKKITVSSPDKDGLPEQPEESSTPQPDQPSLANVLGNCLAPNNSRSHKITD